MGSSLVPSDVNPAKDLYFKPNSPETLTSLNQNIFKAVASETIDSQKKSYSSSDVTTLWSRAYPLGVYYVAYFKRSSTGVEAACYIVDKVEDSNIPDAWITLAYIEKQKTNDFKTIDDIVPAISVIFGEIKPENKQSIGVVETTTIVSLPIVYCDQVPAASTDSGAELTSGTVK